MKYLGIDYGFKRIGIATSDENGEMAFPCQVIKNDNKILESLNKIIKEKEIQKIIIGESKDFKLENNEIMTSVLNLKTVLEKETGLIVELHNEIFSSAMAEHIQGKNTMLDASAATIILQSYLDLVNRK
jgi:putative holliday junction resolvase